MSVPKGSNKIDTLIHAWTEDDRQDAIDFAIYPGNGATIVALYLSQRGVKASLDTVHRWQKSLIAESERIGRIRQIIGEFRGIEPVVILEFLAAAMTEALVNFQEKIATKGSIDIRDVQALTSLSKEARSAASSLISAQPTTSTRDLELGFAMNVLDKLEAIFEADEVVIEKVRLAGKGILTEIEGQYQSQN